VGEGWGEGWKIESQHIMTPLVSICLPNLNTRRFLEPRMESLLAQSLTDWELIISDNDSDDGAWEYFQTFKNDPRIRLQQRPRRGMYDNWNACLEKARGEYLYVATSDDTCEPPLLEKLTGALERHPDMALAVCDFAFIDESGRVMDPEPLGKPSAFYGDWMARPHRRSGQLELLVHAGIGVSWTTMTAVVFRRKLLEQIGLFRTDCGAVADKFWALRAAAWTDTLFVPGQMATWRFHAKQGSRGQSPLALRREVGITRETLQALADRLPAEWRQDPRWMDKILRGKRAQYRSSFRLDREAMRKSPALFLKGLIWAGVLAPGYLLNRVGCAFSWNGEEYGDDREYTNRLVAEWKVPGPVDC